MQNEYHIQKIISSDLNRAMQTANIINEELKLPIEYTEKLREMNNGKLAGMLNEEAERLYPGVYFNSLAIDEKYPGGESPLEFFNRIKNNFEDIVNENKNFDNILLVTHSGVINIIYHIVKNLEWTNKQNGIQVANTSIYKVIIDGKINSLQSVEKIKI